MKLLGIEEVSKRLVFAGEICVSNQQEKDGAAKNLVKRAWNECLRVKSKRDVGQEVQALGYERAQTGFRGIWE